MIGRNYDVVATIGSAGVLMILGAPWPLWAVWTAIAGYQVINRGRHRHA